MRVTIVFLARAGQIVGKHLAKLELPEKATIEDLIEEIGKKISKRFEILQGRQRRKTSVHYHC